MLRRKTAHVVAATLVLGLGAAACSTTSSAQSDRRVLVIGDSLVNGTAATITRGLQSDGWTPIVDGRGGWSIGKWAPALPRVADLSRASAAIVVLGTNDCAPTCRDVDQGITRILHALTQAGVERVFWFNVQEDTDYPAHPDEVNARLELAAAEWPQLSIVDLSDAVGGRPDLHMDHVHFNEAGALALTKLMIDALDGQR